jgi:hypothetical protein
VHEPDTVRSVKDAMAYWVRVELRAVVARATNGGAAVPSVRPAPGAGTGARRTARPRPNPRSR